MNIIKLSDTVKAQVAEKIEEISHALMYHENRCSGIDGISQYDWKGLEENEVIYAVVPGPIFKRLMFERGYINAIEENRDLFGTGYVMDVICALQKIENVSFPGSIKLCEYVCHLCDENMAYIFEIKEGALSERVLRLDLYRGFKDKEFIGGIFHAFKHFTIEGYETLSCVKCKLFEMRCIEEIIFVVAKNFFSEEFNKGKEKRNGDYYIANSMLHDNHSIEGVYYKEKGEKVPVYFLSSLHVNSK